MATPAGRTLRADYTLVSSEPEQRREWQQEVGESPFERILAEAITALELERSPAGSRVRLVARLRLRGFSRFGTLQVRRAWGRQLDGALAGLEALFAEQEEPSQ